MSIGEKLRSLSQFRPGKNIYDEDGDGVEDNHKHTREELDKFYNPQVFGPAEKLHNTHHGNLPGHHLKEDDHTEPEYKDAWAGTGLLHHYQSFKITDDWKNDERYQIKNKRSLEDRIADMQAEYEAERLAKANEAAAEKQASKDEEGGGKDRSAKSAIPGGGKKKKASSEGDESAKTEEKSDAVPAELAKPAAKEDEVPAASGEKKE